MIRDHSIDSLSDDEFARKVRKEVDVIRPKKVDILKENDGISLIFISDNKTEDLCKGGCYYRLNAEQVNELLQHLSNTPT